MSNPLSNPISSHNPSQFSSASLPLAATQTKPLQEEPTLAHLPADIVDYIFRRYLTPQDLPSLRLSFKNSAPTFYSFLNQKKWAPTSLKTDFNKLMEVQKKVAAVCNEPKNALFLSHIHHLEINGLSRRKYLVDCLSSMPHLRTLNLNIADGDWNTLLYWNDDQLEFGQGTSLEEKTATLKVYKELRELSNDDSTEALAKEIKNKKELNSIDLKIGMETKENIQILLDSIHVPFSLSLDEILPKDSSFSGQELRSLLKEKKNLKHLTLSHHFSDLTPADIHGILSDHPQLEKLSLRLSKDFLLQEWNETKCFPALKQLSLTFFEIVREGEEKEKTEEKLEGIKAFLKGNPQLQTLKLNEIHFSDSEWLEILSEMNSLSSLTIPLRSSEIYVQALATKKMQKLKLRCMDLSSELIAQLKSKELLSLDIAYCNYPNAGSLKELVQSQKKLSSLTLSGAHLTQEELRAIVINAEALKFLKVDGELIDKTHLLQELKKSPAADLPQGEEG